MQNIDTGLNALVAVARHFSIAADAKQLERAYVPERGHIDTPGLMRAAKELQLRVRLLTGVTLPRLKKMPFPAIAALQNGNYVVVHAGTADKIQIQDPLAGDQLLMVDLAQFMKLWTGELLLFTKRFELPRKFQKFGFAWFLPVVLKYKRFFLQVLGMSFLLQLFGLATPLFMQVIIDRVLMHRSVHTLDVLILGMILTTVMQSWMMALRAYLFTNTTNKIDVVLSSHLFRTITALPIKYFNKWQTGDVVSRIGELENLRNFITGSALTIVLDVVFAVVYFVVMFMYSRLLSVVVLATLPLFVLLNLFVAPIYKRLINERFLVGAENQSFLFETITGIKTVKTLAVESEFVRRYEEILAKYVKSVFSVINLANIAGSIGLFIQQGFNLAILWIGAYCVMQDEISVGELIAFQMIAGQLIAPVLRLVNMWQYFQQTRVSMERLADIMDEQPEPAFNPNRTTLPSIHGEVFFDHVRFRYKPESSDVLQDVSIRIPPGMKVGIVGHSGSGKSTLTKLVQRLYVPDSGRVLIDGVDLAQVEPAWLRRQIGVVLQENFLFSGTIRENIGMAMPNATDEQILVAAKLAGADEFIRELPQGYDTFVGERGSLLSGGQKQRISIARALLTDPQILIFDEATSALDYESEHIIMENLDQMSEGRTMIMIAHRLSTVRGCQAIIVMDKGRVAEFGTHEQLLARKGFYARLYASQES